MLRTFARRAAAATVPLLTLPAIMLAAAPGTAQASTPSATIQFHNQAQLQPGSVLVTLDYSCNPNAVGPTGGIFAEVQQPGAFGFTTVPATCDDQKHTVTVDVPGAFKPGTAAATASVSNTEASFASTSAELKVS
jgi:hypothetical protein